MTTELAFDIMEKINPDVAEIFTDPEVLKIKEQYKGSTQEAFASVELLVPLMAGKHRKAVFNIVAAISDKTPDEVAKQNFEDTIKAWSTGFVSELFAFFVPTLRMVLKA